MLAKRLIRHGVAVAVGSVKAALAHEAAASVPASVLSSTIKATMHIVEGKALTTGLISANVAALSEAVVKSMLLTKLKKVTTLLLNNRVAIRGMKRWQFG